MNHLGIWRVDDAVTVLDCLKAKIDIVIIHRQLFVKSTGALKDLPSSSQACSRYGGVVANQMGEGVIADQARGKSMINVSRSSVDTQGNCTAPDGTLFPLPPHGTNLEALYDLAKTRFPALRRMVQLSDSAGLQLGWRCQSGHFHHCGSPSVAVLVVARQRRGFRFLKEVCGSTNPFSRASR